MKKNILIIIILFIVILILTNINNSTQEKINNKNELNINEKRAIFISYIELSKYLDKDNTDEIKKQIETMVNNIKQDNFNMILLQTRAFSDSIYNSYIYPTHYLITGNDNEDIPLDILDYFIEISHKNNIELHSWINPYRIRNNTDYTKISIKNPCFKWIGTNNVKTVEDKGIFYNPASDEVIDLIVNGVKEIIDNYNVDGIHFDDYFYPSKEIDLDNYEEYKKTNPNVTITEYRYNNVLKLIEKVSKLTKEKNIEFGISPDGNIDNDYNYHYLNIEELLKKEYVNYIMPQIYYGFQNEVKPFTLTLNDWNNYIKNDIELIPALALYKSGTLDKYAKSGEKEWMEYTNIISNQIKISKNMTNYNGYAIYRYDYFYNNVNDFTLKEVENIRKM